MNIPVALFCVCFVLSSLWSEAQVKRSSFPKWAFCVAYQIRDADHREERPTDPDAEKKDPFNLGDTWIPASVLSNQNIVDVAALSTRVVKSGILKKDTAERVIQESTQGDEWHPIIESIQPRHIFVFYDHEGHPVAAVEVDFEYNRVRMRPDVRPSEGRRGPTESADLASLAKIAVEAGLDLKPFAETVEDYAKRLERQDERTIKLLEELKNERAKKEAEQAETPNGP